MSAPPYMPMWIGDYLRDTRHLTTEQHGAYHLLIYHCWEHDALPTDAAARAQIAGLPLKRWNQIKPAVEAFFKEDGTHGRVTKERARVAQLSTKRKVAGSVGGVRSAIARAKQIPSKSRAPPQQTASKTQPNGQANMQQNRSTAQAYQTKNQKENLES